MRRLIFIAVVLLQLWFAYLIIFPTDSPEKARARIASSGERISALRSVIQDLRLEKVGASGDVERAFTLTINKLALDIEKEFESIRKEENKLFEMGSAAKK